MEQKISYNSEKDIQEVDQFGFVDINKAFQNGYVPGSDVSTTIDSNKIDDPSAIIGKPSDAFEALRMQDSYIEGLKSVSSRGKSSNNGSSVNKDEN